MEVWINGLMISVSKDKNPIIQQPITVGRQSQIFSNMKLIGVIGASHCSSEIYEQARQVGVAIAKANAILVCGGLGGVMEAACRGAKEAGGTTIGILPGIDKNDANVYVDIPIVTGLRDARNTIIARTAEGLIAVSGEYGTLSEIAFAKKFGKPIVSLKSWNFDTTIPQADSAEQAVATLSDMLK